MEEAPSPGCDTGALAELFAAITLAAAAPIMDVYTRGSAPRLKADSSPVTEADEEAERVILAALAAGAPGIPVVSEEAASLGRFPVCGHEFILVDPLDGTREFLARNGEFTVNIALVRGGVPVCGAIYAPIPGKLWFAGAAAFAADVRPGEALPAAPLRRAIATRDPPAEGLRALVSRSHLDARSGGFLAGLAIASRHAAGSSLKFGLIAEGAADVYPRFSPTMEWDIAAGDAILRAAGGMTLGEDGAPMRYGGQANGFRNSGFVAWGRAPLRDPALPG